MFSLQKLHDKNHITGRDFHESTAAYEFLRTVEHRLQLRLGQQVHQLPSEQHRLESLARGRKRQAPVEVVKLPGVNHLFVPATTGEVAEYGTLKEKQISSALAAAISQWLQKTLPPR